MENLNRVLTYHLTRLQDKSPEVRLKSIKELELLGSAESSLYQDILDALKDIYKNDADENVKRAAQKAGQSLFRVRANQK